MQTLWIYGDSFAHEHDLGWAWHDLLAAQWQAHKQNYAFQGTSQIWSINQMMQTCTQWQPGDRVIWLVTHPARYWYHPDYPDISGVHLCNLRDLCLEVDRTGTLEALIQMHGRYMQHPQLVITEYAARLAWAVYTAEHRSTELILLQCFADNSQEQLFEPVTEQWRQHVCMPRGNLSDLSKSEVSDDLQSNMMLNDPRAGHFSRDLHADLADFLDRNWLSKDLDLTDLRRAQPLITKASLRDTQFTDYQFPPGTLDFSKQLWRRHS